MIDSTFQYVPNVMRKGELRLWQSGITTWQKLIDTPKKHPDFTKKMWGQLRSFSIACQQALDSKNYDFFLKNLPEESHWRFFPNLQTQILYFDVELTGLDLKNDSITTIVAFDGIQTYEFIQGENLNDFPNLLNKFPAICTFDGNRADIPFIEKQFDIYIEKIHFDIYSISRLVRLSGGLKYIERILNIEREDLINIDGRSAIYLWKEYQETHDRRYLTTLLAYNTLDAVNLEYILYEFYERLRKYERIPQKKIEYKHQFDPKSKKYHASPEIIELLLKKYTFLCKSK